jgi:glucokinase
MKLIKMNKKLAIGVDLGGTNIRIALGDIKGKILEKISEKTKKTNLPEGISNQIIDMLHSLKNQAIIKKKIQGICIGSTGPFDLKNGSLVKPTNIPLDYVPLVQPIEDEFKLPTYLLNDCSTSVMGEKYFGTGRFHENLAYVTLSTGIGGGVYVDNHLLSGKDGNATEIGHFTIDYEGKLLCSCGKKGHWEAYCSGKNLPNYTRLLLKEYDHKTIKNSLLSISVKGKLNKITSKTLFDIAKVGDPLSLEIVKKIGMLNAVGFGCLIDGYDPSLITVGGAITLNNQELIMSPIIRYTKEHIRNRIPDIIITPLGQNIGLYGALAKVFYPNEP